MKHHLKTTICADAGRAVRFRPAMRDGSLSRGDALTRRSACAPAAERAASPQVPPAPATHASLTSLDAGDILYETLCESGIELNSSHTSSSSSTVTYPFWCRTVAETLLPSINNSTGLQPLLAACCQVPGPRRDTRLQLLLEDKEKELALADARRQVGRAGRPEAAQIGTQFQTSTRFPCN